MRHLVIVVFLFESFYEFVDVDYLEEVWIECYGSQALQELLSPIPDPLSQRETFHLTDGKAKNMTVEVCWSNHEMSCSFPKKLLGQND